jgi:hypothetical protein
MSLPQINETLEYEPAAPKMEEDPATVPLAFEVHIHPKDNLSLGLSLRSRGEPKAGGAVELASMDSPGGGSSKAWAYHDGCIKFVAASGFCLSLAGVDARAGATVELRGVGEQLAQQWVFEEGRIKLRDNLHFCLGTAGVPRGGAKFELQVVCDHPAAEAARQMFSVQFPVCAQKSAVERCELRRSFDILSVQNRTLTHELQQLKLELKGEREAQVEQSRQLVEQQAESHAEALPLMQDRALKFNGDRLVAPPTHALSLGALSVVPRGE